MFDTSKLRGRIIEKYGSQQEFSRVVGCTMSFLSQYLNGKTQLTQKVMDRWIDALDIPRNEIDLYFFTPKVHEMEQEGNE